MGIRAKILLALGCASLASAVSSWLVEYLVPSDIPDHGLLVVCAALGCSAAAFAAAWIALEIGCLSDISRLREHLQRISLGLPPDREPPRTREFAEMADQADRMLFAATRRHALLRTAMEASNIPVCVLDDRLGVIFANTAFQRIIPKDAHPSAPDGGGDLSEALPPPIRDKVLGALSDLNSETPQAYFRHAIAMNRDDAREYDWSVTAVFEDQEKLSCALLSLQEAAAAPVSVEGKDAWAAAALRDRTEIHSLQADLRRREFLLDLAQDPICLVDRDQRYAWANNAYLLRLGLAREELVGKTRSELLDGAEREQIFTQQRDICLSGRETTITIDETGGDGETRRYEIHCAPYPGEATDATHIGAVYRNITKRWRAERTALRNSEQLALMVESISSILIVLDGEDVVAHWNETAARVFGMDADAAVGRPLLELGLGWSAETLSKYLADCRRQREALRIESLPYHRPGEQPKALGLTLNPSHDGPNKSAVLILGNDITDIQTRQMRAIHEQKMHSIGQLTAGVAHELNTPARFVSNNIRFLEEGFDDLLALLAAYEDLAEGLREGRDPGELLQNISALAEEADLKFLFREIPPAISQSLRGMERVSQILQTMKQFSHPGATPKQLVDVNQAVENTCLVTRGEWKRSSKLVLDLEPGLPQIMAMPVELNQALLNVALNAAQANEETAPGRDGLGELIVQTRLADDMEHVLIRISDSGPGVDPANADKLFNLFYTTKDPGQGTGQGLAITRSIVETQHDGSITFENRAEGGVRFTIRLPIGKTTEAKTAR